jgi:hypothetical protein
MTKSNANGSNITIIHMSLQGKGGVGKSLISAILSQYLAAKGQDVQGIDADPVNHTLSEYQGIGARCLNILKDGSVDQLAKAEVGLRGILSEAEKGQKRSQQEAAAAVWAEEEIGRAGCALRAQLLGDIDTGRSSSSRCREAPDEGRDCPRGGCEVRNHGAGKRSAAGTAADRDGRRTAMIEMKDQIESPAELDLNPSPPPTARISKKVRLAGIGVVVLVGILVMYGLSTRKQQQAVARAVNEQKHPEPARIAGDQVVREIAPLSVANPAPAPAGVPESGAPVNDPAISGPILRPPLEITRRNLNIQPTIKIREGYKFNVRVNRDMLFDAPSIPAEMR